MKTKEFNEILYRLERLEKTVKDIRTMLTRTSDVVSTSAFSRGDQEGRVQSEQIRLVPIEKLTESQLAILNEVKSSKTEVTAQDIQERLGYRSRATVSHNLNDLFKLGLLNKRRGRKAFYSVY